MTATEDDIIRDEQERSNWQRVIADVEAAIAASTPGTRRAFENTLESAKKRVATLDKRIEDAKVERQTEAQAQIAAANLMAKEKALSASEKETYSGFLKEAFFTKKDFGKLEQFYAHTYDRLSEGGKDEMSHRVWEGIRHHEYEFTDLPIEVQEKESKRLYGKLTSPSVNQGSLENLPAIDRADFIRSYEAGDSAAAAKVLTRESFRQNVAMERDALVNHKLADEGKNVNDQAAVKTVVGAVEKPNDKLITTASTKFADINMDSLKNVEIANATAATVRSFVAECFRQSREYAELSYFATDCRSKARSAILISSSD